MAYSVGGRIGGETAGDFAAISPTLQRMRNSLISRQIRRAPFERLWSSTFCIISLILVGINLGEYFWRHHRIDLSSAVALLVLLSLTVRCLRLGVTWSDGELYVHNYLVTRRFSRLDVADTRTVPYEGLLWLLSDRYATLEIHLLNGKKVIARGISGRVSSVRLAEDDLRQVLGLRVEPVTDVAPRRARRRS